MMGFVLSGTWYPCAASQSVRALPSVEWSWTVSYGPTCFCEVTVTTGPALASPASTPQPSPNDALFVFA